MSNSRPQRNRVAKSNLKNGRALSQRQSQQLSFAVMAARQMNEQLVLEKAQIAGQNEHLSKLLGALILQNEGTLVISQEFLDQVFTEKPAVVGFSVKKSTKPKGIKLVAEFPDDEEEDEDFGYEEVPEELT